MPRAQKYAFFPLKIGFEKSQFKITNTQAAKLPSTEII